MPQTYKEAGIVRGLDYHSLGVDVPSGLIIGTIGDRVKARPGGELTPEQARAAAYLLLEAANVAEQWKKSGK